jgi:2-oxo-4-hydroxy-4-carboxy--5-ureidoimidazoline (OHCU) decarboxylase
MGAYTITLDELNALDEASFVNALDGVFERGPLGGRGGGAFSGRSPRSLSCTMR